MGMFYVTVTVANPADPTRQFRKEFWVDTGALYSLVPGDALDRIGVAPFGKRRMLLADGRKEQMRIGSAVFHLEGFRDRIPCPVIFGPPGSICLLGATTLEAFSLIVDPARQRLKPAIGLLAGLVA